jgi:hypothetical protein
LFPLLLLVACKSAEIDETRSTGSTSTTTTSYDWPKPPPTLIPEGAARIDFVQTDPATCPLPSHTVTLGEVDASTEGKLLVGDDQGTNVTCRTVLGSAAPRVYGQLISPTHVSVGVEVFLDPETTTGLWGSVDYRPAQSDLFQDYGGSCDFTAPAGTPEGIEANRFWLSFTCPTAEADGHVCAMSGVVLFEGCNASAN